MADRAWIGLGGNIGPVAETLSAARLALRGLARGPLLMSPLVETDPWGLPDQPAFLNQVVGLRPRLGPHETLEALLAIERAHGRSRGERWGPRTLDLDVLTWPTAVAASAALEVPHPRLAERRFVLAPWAAVAPGLRVGGATVAELLARCPDGGGLRWRS
ncbi:MAG: 2-amino-4-hydroxy-6-hydroxymethyldihydropteridine diphosphokinase [Myxococcales bacterium]|nr:2-amino-4-hydroxy-6-hydroxymethyldihydropteridine diphosphokinase [Myxococcales bacterium]